MSAERFEWLAGWVDDPADVIRTPGSESNVKEIYDKCAELSHDPGNLILNQFSEFGNYLGHYLCTGIALEKIFEDFSKTDKNMRLAAYVAGTGSAGTLGAGDYLKERHGARIVAVEPIECPTMLYGGYGDHNIQGIGDKHIPLIQNVMNSDMIVGSRMKAAMRSTSCSTHRPAAASCPDARAGHPSLSRTCPASDCPGSRTCSPPSKSRAVSSWSLAMSL